METVLRFVDLPLAVVIALKHDHHFSSSGAYSSSSYLLDEYTPPTQVVFFATYVSCSGSEPQIEDCYGFLQYQYFAHYCPTSRVASVKCLCELAMNTFTHVFVYAVMVFLARAFCLF